MSKIRVKDHPDLVRDERSGAIININRTEAEKYKIVSARNRKRNDEVQELKDEVRELKVLLQQLIEKK